MKKHHTSLDRYAGLPRLCRSPLLAFLGFMISAISPSFSATNLSWRIEYDDQDRVAARIDPAGRVTHYAYTPPTNGPLQSVTQTPPEGAPVTWRFDAAGQLAAMTDGAGEVAYRYDKNGRLEAVTRRDAPEIHYTYDTAGRLAGMKVGDFYRVGWTYDFLGRIEKMDTPAGPISYEYLTGQNTVVRALPNGVKTLWTRQADGQLKEIIHGLFKKPDDEKYSELAQYTYTYGTDGKITDVRESSGQTNVELRYTYDTMGRLVRAAGAGGREYGYTYDLVGNRVKATASGCPDQICAYDWAGRLASVDGKPCVYDECGNLTDVAVNGVARQYRYQSDGRLAEARTGSETVQYRYDGFGRLVARKTPGGETRFLPDPLAQFWRPLVIDEPDGKRALVVWDGDTPLAIVRAGQAEWLLPDHLGSVRLVVDGKGAVERQCQYDPFGVPDDDSKSDTLLAGLTGLFWDGRAGGYVTLARTLAPALGSFLQPDPVKRIPSEVAQDYSIYAYCGSDPVNLKDLDGCRSRGLESRPSFPVWGTVFQTEAGESFGIIIRVVPVARRLSDPIQ